MAAKLFPFWKLKVTAPTIEERIANGDFETGDLTGWVTADSVQVQGAEKHGGSWAAKLNPYGGITLIQTLATPTPVDKIVSAAFWYKNTFFDNFAAIIYTDDTGTNYDMTEHDGAWHEIDMKPTLYAGKTIKIIEFWVNSLDACYVDDASITAYV